LKTAHGLAALALVVLAVVHVGMAPVFFDQLTMRVMWYVAQGLMGVFAAFLNFACRRLEWSDPGTAALTHVANLLGLVFAIVYATVDSSPPSFLAIGLFALLGGTGVVVSGMANRGA
jgi:hypothetical protein